MTGRMLSRLPRACAQPGHSCYRGTAPPDSSDSLIAQIGDGRS